MTRKANSGDIQRLVDIRGAVRENKPRDATRVTPKDCAWLTTQPGTRAAQFYRKAGRTSAGTRNGELIFEMELAKPA